MYRRIQTSVGRAICQRQHDGCNWDTTFCGYEWQGVGPSHVYPGIKLLKCMFFASMRSQWIDLFQIMGSFISSWNTSDFGTVSIIKTRKYLRGVTWNTMFDNSEKLTEWRNRGNWFGYPNPICLTHLRVAGNKGIILNMYDVLFIQNR